MVEIDKKPNLLLDINKQPANLGARRDPIPAAPAAQVLKIKQIALTALAILAAVFVGTVLLALTATILPFPAFAAAALIAAKVAGIITGIALSAFGLVSALDYIAPKLPRPLSVIANVIHCAITETVALIAMGALYFVDLEKQNPKEGNNQQPILLIHGLYHNSSAWIRFLAKFKEAQLGPVFTINLGKPFDSIEDHAEKVKEKVAEIQEITGRKDITLIGHSMGGLVASRFALNLASDETKVTDIITIGSPLEGTYAGYLGIGKDAKEMRYNSDFVNELSGEICESEETRFLHIGSDTDEIVLPSSSALLEKNVDAQRLRISNLGHAGLLYSDRVINHIIDYCKDQAVEA